MSAAIVGKSFTSRRARILIHEDGIAFSGAFTVDHDTTFTI